MIFKMLLLLSFISIGLSSAQILQAGQCDANIALQEDFNLEEFSGKWNYIEGTTGILQTGDCSTLDISPRSSIIAGTNTFDVGIRSVDENFLQEITGVATAENGTASLNINFASLSKTIDFRIMITNYENYALAYSCENVGTSQRNVYIWQLGRDTSFPSEMIANLMNRTIFTNFGLTKADLTVLEHSDAACHVLPVIPPGQSVILPGQCDPNTRVVQNFQGEQFEGVWHQIYAYYTPNSVGTCNRAEYIFRDGVVEKVINSEVIDQTLRTITGNATVSSTDGSARLIVTLEVTPNNYIQQPLWILATDYTRYAISYSCNNLANNQKQVTSWILSRTRDLPPPVQTEVDRVIDSYYDLNRRFFVKSNQSDVDCFYYPEPNPGQSVVFRGQCDMSIPVMQNFNASAYLGLWHNIQSYPSANQQGTCNNARYSAAEDNSVDVFNTQVIDEALVTIDGVARISSDDGSAKLTVSFPIPGTDITTSTDYWVLTTDYVSYALVYSCTNINEDEMRVFGWKLSRTKTLPAVAESIFQETMRNISVLDERYFENNNQSAEGCFYYPDVKPGVPVVFPGECDDNMPVVNEFNPNLFIGDWYEIEAYPKEFQPGQCVNHKYSMFGNNLRIDSSSVEEQFLITSNSTLVTNGTSGRLSLNTAGPNDTIITIPFWILSVNYQDYAFAYSCVNLEEDKRAIYSWKLSRTNQLSVAANTSINNVISDVVVFADRYYEKVEQSDDACFYLPDLEPGEPIVLLGQCDPNIKVVQNFNVSGYQGRWRLIESYPAEAQTGTCNEARYTAASGNTVEVVNSQVVDEELTSITGSATYAADGSAKLTVTFPNNPTPAEIWVLDTDYSSYSLVYSCRNLPNNTRRIFSWKLSRTRDLTPTAITNINRVIDSIQVLNNRYYRTVNQSDAGCFYYPTPGPGSVVFRGQCDPNITVVTTFDAGRYLNLWHNIESYPSAFQSGTCNNAFYSPGNTSAVDVYNTQVIDQKLETIRGTADLADAANVGKLIVSFPIPGTNLTTLSDYWILNTDYSSYALVYNCVNLDEETRRVSSWKLSRTKSLSAAASDAINAVVDRIPVLDQRYYERNDQSPEGCFYFPEPEPGKVVVFPGQCNETLQAEPNFNMTAFSGTWFETQTYPKLQQMGQCISHNYALSGTNTLRLITNHVRDTTLLTSTSDVRFASPQDASGKLIVTIDAGGKEIQIPFWVLSTDYTDYALAYSCVNVGSDYRQVFSMKLSRSQNLSSDASSAINNAMSNVDVLDSRYYENVNQSDSACFYLPDIPLGQPVTFPGQCDPNIPVKMNFNATRYGGRWRMLETYHSEFQSGECNDATYVLLENGTVWVQNSQVINQELDTMIGSATLGSTDGSAKLLVKFPTTNETADYWILDTDYDSYALVYSCKNIDSNRRRVFSWKLSRTRELTPTAITNINRVIDSIEVLDDRYYKTVNQTDDVCFYYPTPGPGSVVFRGQCDPNITVVTTFDAERYLNLWHNIESYPSAFQSGTCNNAFYSPGNTSAVDVYNTQVIDQKLETIRGTADLADAANVGKLIVSFPIPGTNLTTLSDYWILNTDYSSYALVYNCVNLDEDTRRVSSWKLSRTKSLSAAASDAINAVVDRIPVLDQRYYERNDQSPEGCFYFPEPEPGKVVVFPGQCNETLQAEPNFNMTAFSGTWFETQTYPKLQQMGQCISHNYALSGTNTMRLITNHVRDTTLLTSTSDVRFASPQDASGKLIVTIDAGGKEIQIPFWVLSTDYTDYALAYSCVNVGSDYRQVFSMKLSRSQNLSSDASSAINNAMSNVDVLDSRYYENVNQSDSACFYLPDIPLGQPVTFPGQCDPNIPVKMNFNATRYGGRWRMLETYHSEFQSGECNDATYVLLENGTVWVQNSQVINQELDTMIGSATLGSTDGSAKLLVQFPTTNETADYWILDTDYDSYALVYSCKNIDSNRRRVWSWKLSRTRNFTTIANSNMNAIIDNINVLDSRYYQEIDHRDAACFYYPEVDGKPVVYRGQCEDNLPLVNNFNAADYLETWYDIESYPTNYQFGSCPTATYTLNGSVVDVYNTEVVNQRLSSVNGVAVPYPDGSSRLTVSFPIPGTQLSTSTPYWVLSTDYVNYALVYSCVNVDDEHRTVASWKLSRTKTLSSASKTAINNVISTIPVLRNKYYNVRGHLEDDCFYYPENNGGPVELDGECAPNTIAVPNFNLESFSGSWYEVSRYPSELRSGECVSNNFVSLNQNSFTLTKTFVSDEVLIEANGTATLSNDGRGILNVRLTDNSGVSYDTTMYVMDVNYTDYALLYGCRSLGNGKKQVYSWKFSRNQEGLSPEAIANISNIVTETKDLWDGYYEVTDQTDNGCFHYPEFEDLPEQINLIGRCDESIRGMANFNASAYLGKWFELASYPQPYQYGDCSRAYYSTTDGVVVNVMNTEVSNRTLNVAYATAVVASTDGSGVLNVTFSFPGGVSTTSNYYVLDTDYTSYALVYSCRNLQDGRRQVTSWKLSRDKSLSPQVEAIMDNIINNTQGLLQRYYSSTNQSEDACFYIPDANKNEAPVFRGQCQNVIGMQGFNAQRYLGWWHEIESYPTDMEAGSCISSEFKTSGNTYQIVDTKVQNNSATVVTSTVTVTNDGRLRKTFSDGRIVDILVLATDYETYSLLYSCENINEDYKRVWSAKHSKIRELSQEAQNVIASYMNDNRVLEPQFYFSVDQSDKACFHYPKLTGDQVILPGQCDLNIPVEMQFDAAQYSGTWYQVERYPQRFESGNCTGARYTLNTDTGVVTVLNWQVIDGVLDTIEGTGTINSTDGSARLLINLPIRGTDEPDPPMVSMLLYVLKTDYISYSLAYSCVNVGPYQRAVGAWKLSRTRNMTDDGNVAINTYMANREEFNADYFVTVEQSETCSEPSSGVIVKSSIIVLLSIALLHLL